MKRLSLILLLLAVSAAFAQSPFDGTWKVAPAKAEFPSKPTELKVTNGRFTCSSCVPKIDVKADGTPQAVAGSPYYDKVSVKVLSDNSVETESSKGDKAMFKNTYQASDDGKTLTVRYEDHSAANGQEQRGVNVLNRVGSAPSSGNKVTGQWKMAKVEDVTDNSMTFTFTGAGDELTYKAATGEGYTAKLDGKDYPYKGDPGTTSVSLKALDDHTFEETDKRDGKPIFVAKISVSSDGKTMTIAGQDKLRGTTMKFVADKQQGTAAGN